MKKMLRLGALEGQRFARNSLFFKQSWRGMAIKRKLCLQRLPAAATQDYTVYDSKNRVLDELIFPSLEVFLVRGLLYSICRLRIGMSATKQQVWLGPEGQFITPVHASRHAPDAPEAFPCHETVYGLLKNLREFVEALQQEASRTYGMAESELQALYQLSDQHLRYALDFHEQYSDVLEVITKVFSSCDQVDKMALGLETIAAVGGAAVRLSEQELHQEAFSLKHGLEKLYTLVDACKPALVAFVGHDERGREQYDVYPRSVASASRC